MASLVITETAGISVVEPRVFERNGLAYANTRDLAAFAGRDHRVAVRSLERALKRQPRYVARAFGVGRSTLYRVLKLMDDRVMVASGAE